MDFLFKDGNVNIISDKKNISLEKDQIILDELSIDSAWEYEKWGFLMYVKEVDMVRYYYFRVEWYWVAYIPVIPQWEMDSKILDFFGQLDILVAPFSISEKKLLEQIEPRMLVTFSEKANDLVWLFGAESYRGDSYKLKSQDISSEKTALIILER